MIGTRSAVATPMPALGLVVVDEEHDASYKQQEGFRYSGARPRDRARAARGRAGRARLRDALARDARECGRRPLREGLAASSAPAAPESRALRSSTFASTRRATVSRRPRSRRSGGISTRSGQVLVFLNRRGYAPTMFCSGCGWLAPCKSCDARLTVHLRARLLACHHCGAEEPLPFACPRCGNGARTRSARARSASRRR